ncbi:hypothetical protein SUGI_1340820 [Cryptomeria japonica]|uniref:Uncharacterized protein n=1 Tax=Cryptomeria japonica TaxID=3369 RepID=A0AAD3NRP7_CRYJA|nr:hypothetical protein SUGI_1340820 [Cryptomeria japonica]
MISALSVLIIICYGDGLSTGTGSRDSLSLGASLIGNQTITSKNGMFELGIFSPNGSNNWYLGIWYANIPEKMVVWVANRENPGKHRPGVLKLSKGGTLGLFDAGGMSLWSANVSYKPSRAVLLDSGKASLLEKLYGSRTWAFVLHLDPSGAKQFVLTWNNSVQFWESGNWDNKTFSGMPENPNRDRFNVSFKSTSSGFYFSYELQTGIPSLIKINSGGIQEFALYDNTKWIMVEIRPRDQCAAYGFCGPCGSCNSNNLEFCSCVEGFIPADKRARDSQDWSSSGCVRQSPLNCDTKKGSTDEFIEAGVTLPDDSASSYSAPNKGDCQKACLRNCSCTAFAFNSPSGRCQIWSGDLLNMNNSPSNRRGNVSIRVAALKVPKHKKWSSSQLKTIIIVSALALTVALSIISFLMSQRCRLRPPKETCAVSSDFGMTLLEIISGRRSLDLSVQDSSQYYFPAWAAAQIYEGKMINIVDERVAAEADVEEVRRAGIVGLLCIEREEERRPSMEQVLRMLEGKMEPPTPQMPSSAVRETQAYRSNTDSDGNDIVDCGLLE